MAVLMLLLTSLLFILFLSLQLWQKSKSRRKTNQPPGPPKLPIIGNLHLMGSMPHVSLRQLADRYGPIIHLQLGQVPTVAISSSKLAMEVMKTHDLAFANRPKLKAAGVLLYNYTDIGFAPYGPYWREIKKICVIELLSSKRVQSFSFVREEEVEHLVEKINSSKDQVNLSENLVHLANNIICKVALGKKFSEGGEYEVHGFHRMLAALESLLGGFSIGDYFASLDWVGYLTGMHSKLQKTFRDFDRFFDEVIDAHLDPKRSKGVHKDLLDVLLEIENNGNSNIPLTRENIKAILLDMFAAGTVTTFVTLDWAMAELVMNPRVMKKAQAEVRNAINGERRKVQESDLEQLHYLKAIIKEVLRLHPASPVLLPREAMEDVLIGGYDISAKTRILVNVWAIGRDPERWESPEEFWPERFIGSTIDFKGNDFDLIPFGAGRRGCPGITFSIATMELVLAELLCKFDWELPSGMKAEDIDNTEAFGITMRRKVDLIVVAKPF